LSSQAAGSVWRDGVLKTTDLGAGSFEIERDDGDGDTPPRIFGNAGEGPRPGRTLGAVATVAFALW